MYASVIAETVVADAGAGAEMLDASPMVTAATNAITAQPRDRSRATHENRAAKIAPGIAKNAECYRAGTVGTAVVFGHGGIGLLDVRFTGGNFGRIV